MISKQLGFLTKARRSRKWENSLGVYAKAILQHSLQDLFPKLIMFARCFPRLLNWSLRVITTTSEQFLLFFSNSLWKYTVKNYLSMSSKSLLNIVLMLRKNRDRLWLSTEFHRRLRITLSISFWRVNVFCKFLIHLGMAKELMNRNMKFKMKLSRIKM